MLIHRASLFLRYLASRPIVLSLAKLGEIVGKFAIFAAIVTWLLEIPDRRQQSVSSAWTLLNAAQGKPGEGGRGYALEALARAGAPLTFVDLTYAVLQDIRMPRVMMMHAIFNKAQLARVSFGCRWWEIGSRCSDFSHAKFVGSNLVDVNFDKADISSAQFEKTVNFIGVTFRSAYMISTKFYNVSIQYVDFSGALMVGTVFDTFDLGSFSPDQFRGASLSKVIFVSGALPTSIFTNVKVACDVTLPDGSVFNRNCAGRPDSDLKSTPVGKPPDR